MAKLTEEEFNKKLENKYGVRPDVDFWSGIFYKFYSDDKMTLKKIYKLCDEMTATNQYIK